MSHVEVGLSTVPSVAPTPLPHTEARNAPLPLLVHPNPATHRRACIPSRSVEKEAIPIMVPALFLGPIHILPAHLSSSLPPPATAPLSPAGAGTAPSSAPTAILPLSRYKATGPAPPRS